MAMQQEGDDQGCLKCSCVLENCDKSGIVTKRQTLKKATLYLGRNDLNDIVIKIEYSNRLTQGPFTIKQFNVHKKFLHEGKATIHLLNQRFKIMISNSPPEHLKGFLTSLNLKVSARGTAQGKKQAITGVEPTNFQEISPLTFRDLEMAKKNKGLTQNLSLHTPNRIKNSGSMKRKLTEIQESNTQADYHEDGPASKRPLILKSSSSSLCEEQLKVINLVKSGVNVFFTGSAGTGKTYLLQRIIKTLPPESTFVTASTGAAACHIGGTTLHSFAGIGTGEASLDQCLAMASKDHRAATWRRCKCLIIDEISMVDAEFFDKIEAIARMLCNSDKPFGGIQLVLCGDFLQLPPVSKWEERKQFCFQSKSWKRCITRTIELVEIYRQNDKQFIAALQNIRIGRCPDAVTKLLLSTESQKIEAGGIQATRLYTHTNDVDLTNQRKLNELTSNGRTYTACDSSESMRRQIDNLCLAPHELMLKIGAQVMLVKNIDVSAGLVNGARGVVTKFNNQGFPIIEFLSGRKETIGMEKWVFKVGGGNVVYRKQLPLALAWAMSIHKSQGMTLDCVEISLGRAFEKGQAYVALSRAKNLKTLRVLDFTPSCVQADSAVLDFYRCLRKMRRNFIE